MKKSILTLGVLLSTTCLSFGQQDFYDVNGGDGNGLRFSGSNAAKISVGGFSTAIPYRYGPVNLASMKMIMPPSGSGSNQYGWTWGSDGEIPIAALSAIGDMQIEKNFVALGNIGIGTIAPSQKLTVNGNILFGDGDLNNNGESNLGLEWHTSNYGSGFGHRLSSVEVSGITFMNFDARHNNTNWSTAMSIGSTGNIGIGTTKVNGFKLSVAGKMRAEEIEVSLSTGWADYVFAKDYQLKSLEEVEKFIKENNHLPNIPSAKEVDEKGLNLGEMQVKMMEKIEELTLHTIEQQKLIDILYKKIEVLSKL